jgi:hypothetical protein
LVWAVRRPSAVCGHQEAGCCDSLVDYGERTEMDMPLGLALHPPPPTASHPPVRAPGERGRGSQWGRGCAPGLLYLGLAGAPQGAMGREGGGDRASRRDHDLDRAARSPPPRATPIARPVSCPSATFPQKQRARKRAWWGAEHRASALRPTRAHGAGRGDMPGPPIPPSKDQEKQGLHALAAVCSTGPPRAAPRDSARFLLAKTDPPALTGCTHTGVHTTGVCDLLSKTVVTCAFLLLLGGRRWPGQSPVGSGPVGSVRVLSAL